VNRLDPRGRMDMSPDYLPAPPVGGGGCGGGDDDDDDDDDDGGLSSYACGGPSPAPVQPPPAPSPICDISLFSRPAGFALDPGSHTYIDFLNETTDVNTIIEGGPNHTPGPNQGTLEGFINPPAPPLGVGTGHVTNPQANNNKELGMPVSVPCGDLGTLESDVAAYNVNPVAYAKIPNGSSTYNSNSFTYTLISQLGLSLTTFGPPSLPTSFSPLRPLRRFYPGWGFMVPGL